MNKQPKITVVTVCYNAEKILEKTILSVIHQTYTNIEYLVIDGGSKDGTVDIIRKYEAKITGWISEPDKGIYDAMNKGIRMATGDYINFMNADDFFAGEDALADFVSAMGESREADIYYGNVYGLLGDCKRALKAFPLITLKREMAFSHQAAFVKTSLMKEFNFNLTYKLAADYNFFLSMYMQNCTFQHIPVFVSKVRLDAGASHNYMIKSKKEVRLIHLAHHYGAVRANYLFYRIMLLYHAIKYIKRIMPQFVLNKLQHIKPDENV